MSPAEKNYTRCSVTKLGEYMPFQYAPKLNDSHSKDTDQIIKMKNYSFGTMYSTSNPPSPLIATCLITLILAMQFSPEKRNKISIYLAAQRRPK